MFHCEKCNKTYKTQSGYIRHDTRCSNIKEFNCTYCKEQFYSKWTLNKHLEEKSCKGYLHFVEQEIELKKQEVERYKQEQNELIDRKKQEVESYKQTIKELEYTHLQHLMQKDKEHFEDLKQKDLQLKLEQDLVKKLQNDLQRQIEETKEAKQNLQREQNHVEELNKHCNHIFELSKHSNAKVINTYNNNHIQNNVHQYNLPVLTNEKLGDFMSPITFDPSYETVDTYCKQISNNGLKQFVYVTNQREGNVVYNDGEREVRDKKGASISEQIAKHPITQVNKDKLKRDIQLLEQQLQDDSLSEIERDCKFKQYRNLQSLHLSIDQQEKLQKSIYKSLNHVNTAANFRLSKFLTKVINEISEHPCEFYFKSPIECIVRAMYRPKELLILDDNDKPYKLTKQDYMDVIDHLYKHCNMFSHIPTEKELDVFREMASKHVVIEENIYMLQQNLHRYSTILDDTDQTKQEVQIALESIQYNDE